MFIKKNSTLFVILLVISSLCFGINPQKEYQYSPQQVGIKSYDSITINTNDGYKLASWFFSPIKNKKNILIVIVNGDSGNMSYSLWHVKNLLESGYSVLTFDYRGFGKSDSFPIQKNHLYQSEFVDDLQSVIKYAKDNYSDYKIGLMSFSMGTIISTFAVQNNNVSFIISENYVTNPDSIVKRILRTRNKIVLLPKNESNYSSLLDNIKCPILFFAGIKDKITTLNDVIIVAGSNKNRVVKKHNGNHAEGLIVLTKKNYGDIYTETINKFITQIQ